jgi:CrcB protein
MAGRPSTVVVAVAVGGMVGASARYGLSRLVPAPADGFPWTTLLVNVSGAFALGLLAAMVIARRPHDRLLRPMLGTGVLGGYTTFSTLAVEADLLVKDGRAGVAAAYVLASVAAGLVAVAAGAVVGRRA